MFSDDTPVGYLRLVDGVQILMRSSRQNRRCSWQIGRLSPDRPERAPHKAGGPRR